MQGEAEQATVRCTILRGGTSKGLFFHESDLPAPGSRRDRLLQRLMGSPDVLQIVGEPYGPPRLLGICRDPI